MKRFLGIMVGLLLLSGAAAAANVVVELKAQYFSPSDQAFRDIYGGGIMYGGELSIGVWKGLEVWLGGSYFSKEGELSFTKEKTELEIIPIGAGLKYRWRKSVISFYVGAGLSSYTYRESNPIGDINDGGIGGIVEIGGYVKVTGGLMIDLFVNYSNCGIKPTDVDVEIGGLGAGVGLAYEF